MLSYQCFLRPINKPGTGAEMLSAIVSGIVTANAHVSYRPIFPLFLSLPSDDFKTRKNIKHL